MAPILYCMDGSPCSRAVYLTASALKVPLERRFVNLVNGEQLKPEFLKLNPQHTIPVLKEGDFVICDSHAITAYLVRKYPMVDSLYPKDFRKRALVDERLHFESSVLFPRLAAIVGPVLREGAKTIPKSKADAVMEGYNFLEASLEGRKYVAGENLTIADFHTVTTVTNSNALVPIAANRFPNILKWIREMQRLPYYNENQVGLDRFTTVMKQMLESL